VTTLKAWLSQDGGQSFKLKTLSQTTGHNDHPRLAQSGSKMVVVWRTTQETQVHDIAF
jgi:predicted neuraminidase